MIDKQAQLAIRLYEKTIAGELDWKPSPRPDWYQVSFAQYSIRIGAVQGHRGEDMVFEVVNGLGEVADRISDEDLNDRTGPPGQHDSWFAAMSTVYDRARRLALGADKAIDDILNQLD